MRKQLLGWRRPPICLAATPEVGFRLISVIRLRLVERRRLTISDLGTFLRERPVYVCGFNLRRHRREFGVWVATGSQGEIARERLLQHVANRSFGPITVGRPGSFNGRSAAAKSS